MSAGAIADLFVLLSAKDMGLIAKFGEGGAAGERMAVQVAAAMTEVEASVARVAESTRMVVTAGNEMAVAWERDIAAMRASTLALSEGMVAAEAKAATATAEMSAALDTQAAKSAGLAGALGISNKALMGAGVVAAAAGLEFAHMAGDFNMATTRLVTSAGETEANLDMVRKGILGMAGAVGYSADELAAAMYKVESGGQHGAAGLKVLQAAAEGAKTENADLRIVADALTSAMVDYKFPAEEAATVTSKLVAATSQGKMTFEELAGSMAAILPVASANHVSLDDILGDLASMTVHGMSAQQAAQNLADAIRHMAAPTQLQSKELAILGIKSQDLVDVLGTKGLSGTIDLIGEHIRAQMGPGASKVILDLGTALNGLNPKVQELAGHVLDGSMTMGEYSKAAKGLDVVSAKQALSFAALAGTTHTIGTEQISAQAIMQSYTKAMRDSMGDATGLNVALMIGGENAGITANAIKVVVGAAAEAGGHVKGWAEIQGEFNTKVAQAKDGMGALAISIGEKLLPVLTPLVGALAAAATWLSQHQMAAGMLAALLAGAMVVGLVAATVAMWGYVSAATAGALATLGITAPLWVIIAIVAAVAIVVYEIITHWSQIKSFFSGVWNFVKETFTSAKNWIGDRIHDIVGFVTDIPGKIRRGLESLGQVAIDAWHNFQDNCRRGADAALVFFRDLPFKAGYALGALIGILIKAAMDGWHAFSTWTVTTAEEFWTWLKALPGRVWDFLSALPGRLADLALRMWRSFKDSAVATAEAFWAWLKTVPGAIGNFLASLPGMLADLAVRAWHAFTGGVTSAAEDTWGFLRSIPGRVVGAIGDLGNLLVNIGRSIIDGLLRGIKAAYQGMISFVSGIGAGIAANKGPIEYDRTLLTPHGNAIMDGLLAGLKNGHGRVQEFVKGIAGGLQADMGAGGLDLNMSTGGLGALPGAAGITLSGGMTGGGGVQVNLNVQGHVWATQDLVREVQSQLLRHGIRNNSPGIDYSFA